MIFIGYEIGTKGYRCLDPLTMKVHISRDVVFEEGSKWEWNIKECADDENQFHPSSIPNLVIDNFEEKEPIPREMSTENS